MKNEYLYDSAYFTSLETGWTSLSFPIISKTLIKSLQSLTPKPENYVLDLGCGSGVYESILSSTGCHVIGIDYAVDGLTLGPSGCEMSRIVADACHLPIKNEQLYIIFSTEVLEHILDTERAIGEMYRTLADGGRIILTTTLYYSAINTYLSQAIKDKHSFKMIAVNLVKYFAGYFSSQVQQQFIQEWCFTILGGHYHGFKPSHLKKIIRNAGFTIVESRPLYVFEPIGFSRHTTVRGVFRELSFPVAVIATPIILLIKVLNRFLKLLGMGANNIFLVCQKPNTASSYNDVLTSKVPLRKNIIDLLCCPTTKQSVRFNSEESFVSTNFLSDTDRQECNLVNRQHASGVLVREDGLISYKVCNGIPIMTESHEIRTSSQV